jgi:hypothetical protein
MAARQEKQMLAKTSLYKTTLGGDALFMSHSGWPGKCMYVTDCVGAFL